MLTRDGCLTRISRFRAALDSEWDAALVHLPEHLLYLGNYFPTPNGLNDQGAAFLLIERDGPVTLFGDNWHASGVGQAPAAATTCADRIETVDWYTCERPARLRAAAVAELVAGRLEALRVRRLVAEWAHLPFAISRRVAPVRDCEPTLRRMREIKDADEIEAIRRGIRAAEAMHAASREILRPGLSELSLYAELHARAVLGAGAPMVLLCDLASGPRAAQGGGPPTTRIIGKGELVILDLFPMVEGYRGDITNTLVAGLEPSAEQRDLFAAVHGALEAAEALLVPGTPVEEIYRATDAALARSGAGRKLVHHAGHAIGLGHPEAPELVPHSDRRLEAGMVLTLEPGLYGQPTGGLRLEHDYLVTAQGCERLSQHRLSLD